MTTNSRCLLCVIFTENIYWALLNIMRMPSYTEMRTVSRCPSPKCFPSALSVLAWKAGLCEPHQMTPLIIDGYRKKMGF